MRPVKSPNISHKGAKAQSWDLKYVEKQLTNSLCACVGGKMSSPDRPNILFIISDQHRRDYSGCYGHPIVRTPQLDRLAAAGARFTGAISPMPLCGPARASALTGTHVHTHRYYNHNPQEPWCGLPTLGSLFSAGGYATGSFGKVHIKHESREQDFGFQERALRYYCRPDGVEHYRDAAGDEYARLYNPEWGVKDGVIEKAPAAYNPENRPLEMPDEAFFDHLVAERTIDFLRRHREQPFCAWVGFEKPHPHLYVQKRFHDIYDPADFELPETNVEQPPDMPVPLPLGQLNHCNCARGMTPARKRGCMAAYCACISHMDEQVGRVLDELDTLGLAKNTVVVYTSDHGEMLFAHGLLQKHCFYEESVAVPLLIRGPGIAGGKVRNGPVSLIDLLPTLLELAGLPMPATLEGQSLAAPLRGTGTLAADRPVFSEFYWNGRAERMLRKGRFKYVYFHDDPHELYELEADPHELRNRINDPEYAEIAVALRAEVLADWEFPEAEKLIPSYKALYGGPERSWQPGLQGATVRE